MAVTQQNTDVGGVKGFSELFWILWGVLHKGEGNTVSLASKFFKTIQLRKKAITGLPGIWNSTADSELYFKTLFFCFPTSIGGNLLKPISMKREKIKN